MGAAHAVGRAGGGLEERGAAVDGELGLAVEDDEHLFHVVVEVVADAALGLDDAAVEKDEVGVEGLGVEEAGVVEFAGASVDAFGDAELVRFGALDALGEGVLGGKGGGAEEAGGKGKGEAHSEHCIPNGAETEMTEAGAVSGEASGAA